MKNFKFGKYIVPLIVGLLVFAGRDAHAALSVVTSTPELASIAHAVGGSHVTTYSIARPNQDYHQVEPRPSDVQRIATAGLVVRTGLDLDMWMDSLMNAAGNPRVNKGGAAYVDASEGIHKIEIPNEQISGASGDIHVYGNPHYFYDPVCGQYIARNIARGLIRVDPGNAEAYRANLEKFYTAIRARIEKWKSDLAPYAGHWVVTYHKNYDYFIVRFGLRFFGTLEPKPGIPPSASHINNLIALMKKNNVKAVVIEAIYPTRYPELIQREVGANYVVAPYSVGTMGADDYIEMIDLLVAKFKQALSQ